MHLRDFGPTTVRFDHFCDLFEFLHSHNHSAHIYFCCYVEVMSSDK